MSDQFFFFLDKTIKFEITYSIIIFLTDSIHLDYLERVMKNKLLHISLLYVTVNNTQSCTALMYLLQVKFDFRLILI